MRALILLGVSVPLLFLACSDDGASGSGGNTTTTGQSSSAQSTSNGFGTGGGGGGLVECTVPCMPGEICSHGTCVPQMSCSNDNQCSFDTFCDETLGLCVPWDSVRPGFDDTCIQLIPPGLLSPKVKCEFSTAPMGDPFPTHVDVQGTPVVANFNNPPNAGKPSIAASFTATVVNNYTENFGVIRVLRGDDCTLEANLGGVDLDNDSILDYTVSSASLAVGDLDGDQVAEIVAFGSDGSLLAFTKKNGAWGLLWKSPYPMGAPWQPCTPANNRCPLGWAGPSIHDLDNDGSPEILREGVVYGADGMVLSLSPPGYASYRAGLFPVVANLDDDAAIELSNGALIWEWQAGVWVQDAAYPGATVSAPGFLAVADFGPFGAGPTTDAELAIVRDNAVMVQALDGSYAMSPVTVPGSNPGGGPPTVSDFDGDGLVEVGIAGRAYYTVFDIDCGPTPRAGGTCMAGNCDFAGGPCAAGSSILWSRSTQDLSSNVTGSSIFDFEADGTAEVVYGDECFVRVYNGTSGEVLFSQYRSSCTWYENPIIADVDGNFRADLVSPSNKACSPTGEGIPCQTLNPDGVDPQWNGLRCEQASDCVSGVCDAGLCRCAASADCCAAADDALCVEGGLQCAPPNAGTAGTGNTCRASHPHGLSGIRVYSDANDKWVRSRTIWSQHAYAVTHINENGTVPSSSQWQKNWLAPELNNFRQNVPGDPNGNAAPDSTAGASVFDSCQGGTAELRVDICNRGSAPMASGVPVGYYVAGSLVCSSATTMALLPDACETVSCLWDAPPNASALAVDVDVIANDGAGISECKEGNNAGVIQGVWCAPPS